MASAQRHGIEPAARERVETRIVREEHVGARDQPSQHVGVARVFAVELDAALVAVDREEIRALAFEKWRSPGARLIADLRSFDLDDVGAEIAEQHRAVGSRERLRHVDDFCSVQRSGIGHERFRLLSIIAR